MSHPVWVCGLKLDSKMQAYKDYAVTPCMGVWIETQSSSDAALAAERHTLYGCVD